MKYDYKAEVGLERESLLFNNRYESKFIELHKLNKHVTKDFADSQVEFITDVQCCPDCVVDDLTTIIKNAELNAKMWPLSVPGDLDFNIRIANLDDNDKFMYRKYLLSKYPIEKQILSGIHLNLSYTEDIIQDLHAKTFGSYSKFKQDLYFKTYKKLSIYLPFLVYLNGFTPYFNKDTMYQDELSKIGKNIGLVNSFSLRNSTRFGYSNERELELNHSDVKAFKHSITQMIQATAIQSEKELYTKLRLKSSEGSILDNDINYIEIRCIDNNPFILQGITNDQIEIMYTLFMYLLEIDDVEIDKDTNKEILDNIDQVAHKGADLRSYLKFNGKEVTILDFMQDTLLKLKKCKYVTPLGERAIDKYLKNLTLKQTDSYKLINELKTKTVHDFGMEIMQTYDV